MNYYAYRHMHIYEGNYGILYQILISVTYLPVRMVYIASINAVSFYTFL